MTSDAMLKSLEKVFGINLLKCRVWGPLESVGLLVINLILIKVEIIDKSSMIHVTVQVTDWWEEYVYLRGRSPIMVNSNFYGVVRVFFRADSLPSSISPRVF